MGRSKLINSFFRKLDSSFSAKAAIKIFKVPEEINYSNIFSFYPRNLTSSKRDANFCNSETSYPVTFFLYFYNSAARNSRSPFSLSFK
jgi:hypothetical protein